MDHPSVASVRVEFNIWYRGQAWAQKFRLNPYHLIVWWSWIKPNSKGWDLNWLQSMILCFGDLDNLVLNKCRIELTLACFESVGMDQKIEGFSSHSWCLVNILALFPPVLFIRYSNVMSFVSNPFLMRFLDRTKRSWFRFLGWTYMVRECSIIFRLEWPIKVRSKRS